MSSVGSVASCRPCRLSVASCRPSDASYRRTNDDEGENDGSGGGGESHGILHPRLRRCWREHWR